MSSSDEEKKPIENKFIETIEKVFEEDRWDDIKTLLNKVREKRGKAEDGCGKYGDDSTTRSCPEKWCKQAFQVFKRSAVIS